MTTKQIQQELQVLTQYSCWLYIAGLKHLKCGREVLKIIHVQFRHYKSKTMYR